MQRSCLALPDTGRPGPQAWPELLGWWSCPTMRPQHFEQLKFLFCFYLSGRLGALSTCCRACVFSGGWSLRFSLWLGHVCLQWINFLVWWQAPSRSAPLCWSLCLLVCFRALASGKVLGSPPAHLTSMEPEDQSSRPQLRSVQCHACLFAYYFTLRQVPDLFSVFLVGRVNNIVN